MHQTPRSVLTSILVITLLAGCAALAGSSGPATTAPDGTAPAPSIDKPGIAISAVVRLETDPAQALLAADAINDLGFDLLRTATDGAGNAVLSPASIGLALALARAGARGETAAEMDEVLRNVASDENAAWLAALDAALAQRTGTFKDVTGKDADVTLRIVNAPFAQADYAWEQPYLDALAARFGAGVRLVDYIRNPDVARLAINAWVDEQTERRIPELLPDDAIDSLTRLVLVNAIYLKAGWQRQFRTESTKPGTFHRLDGSTVEVPTMHGRVSVRLAESDGWLAVDVPYVGNQLSMLLILPDDLPSFEATLDGARLASIVGALEDDSVRLGLPRFGIESKLGLAEQLAGLGMPLAFDADRADFSGMTAADRLFISDVIHQANIDVDETGTEAAAATAVVMEVVSAPRDVIIDRPFLFALRDRETGAILFLGRVVEPVER